MALQILHFCSTEMQKCKGMVLTKTRSFYQYSYFELETTWLVDPSRISMDQPLLSFLLKGKMVTYQNCLFQVWKVWYQLRFLVKLVVYKSRCLRMVVLTVLLFVTILFVLNLHLQYQYKILQSFYWKDGQRWHSVLLHTGILEYFNIKE